MQSDFFQNICSSLKLGRLKGKPKRVSGGYMHKMYRIKTDTGQYAVKILNPSVMQRADVFDNYRLAERLEKKLQVNGIPVIPALEFNHQKMQCIDNQYFYVFSWINGKSLKAGSIKEEHCRIMGKTLAQIHNIEFKRISTEKRDVHIDWDYYIALAEKICPQISNLLVKNRARLYDFIKKGNQASRRIPEVSCICNGDMDSKNVLWVADHPFIIDLECLNYGNPYTELFQLALCWCGYEHCKINYNLLGAFIRAYLNEADLSDLNWEDLYYSNVGRLEWLEYNIKRALLIECEDRAEQKLGIAQVKETINHIVYYEKCKCELLTFLNQI